MEHEQLELFNFYRHGLLKRRGKAAAPPGFSELISEGIRDWEPPEAKERLKSSYRNSFAGLMASREGRLQDARACFAASKKELDRLEGGMEQVAISFYEAAVAYLDYREGREHEALVRVGRVLEADLALEQDHGLPVMLIHRVQQGHNMARVDLRLDRRHGAFRLSGLLLAYLEGRLESLPYHHSWSPQSREKLPGHLVRGMIRQIAGEAASYLSTGPDEAGEWSVFLEAAAPEPPGEQTQEPQVQNALCARRALLDGQHDLWREYLRLLFQEGPGRCPEIFYAGVIDFVDWCRGSGTARGTQLAGVIERDASKWKDCNPFLRQRLLEGSLQIQATA